MTKKPADIGPADESQIKAPVKKPAPRLTEAQRQTLVLDIATALQAHGIGFTVWPGETPNQTIH